MMNPGDFQVTVPLSELHKQQVYGVKNTEREGRKKIRFYQRGKTGCGILWLASYFQADPGPKSHFIKMATLSREMQAMEFNKSHSHSQSAVW